MPRRSEGWPCLRATARRAAPILKIRMLEIPCMFRNEADPMNSADHPQFVTTDVVTSAARTSEADSQAGIVPAQETAMRRVLHIGCGPVELKKLPTCFHGSGWQEVRLDIDPRVKPDIVANMLDMAPVA